MIKKARIAKGLSQKQLSKKTKISQSYLSKLEQQEFTHSPTVTQVLALSKALNIDKVTVFLYFADKEMEFYKK